MMAPAERRRRLVYLDGQIAVFTLYAQWSIAKATTGVAQLADIADGNGTPLTPERKLERALQAARQQIQWVQECIDSRDELLKEEYEGKTP